MSNITKLKDVKPGMEGVNLVAKVLEMREPRVVKTRYGEAKTAVALIEDETGEIRLKLWRSQVDLVKPGVTIRIENGFSTEFGGATEISVGSKGQIVLVNEREA